MDCQRCRQTTTRFIFMTHNFHWNVKGPQFNRLHNLFMTQQEINESLKWEEILR